MYNTMQLLKRRFYALRNGVVADALRRTGSPYKIIFGLNLPQLREVAQEFAGADGLCADLRADVRCRESLLLAPMLVSPDSLSQAEAAEWLCSVQSAEEADILCHSLLRKMAGASGLACGILASDSSTTLQRYAALRLLVNLQSLRNELSAQARRLVEAEMAQNNPVTAPLCGRLLE